MRVLNFDDFTKLYEEEEGQPLSEDAESILLQIGVLFFNAYGYMLALTKDYPDTLRDFQSVVAAAAEAKPAELKKIANNVAAQVREEFKKDGVDKLWLQSAVLSADALGALMNQFKDNKESQDAASSMLNKKITGYLEQLQKSKKDNLPESKFILDGEQIFEGFFTTKKGSIRNLKKQAIMLDSLLTTEAENEETKVEAQKLLAEVTGILADLAKLEVGKKEDIDEEKLETISNRLTEIPLDLNKKKAELAKTNKSFADASTLFVKALNAANKALAKEQEVKGKLAEEGTKAKEAEEKAGQSTIRLPKNITRAAVGSKEDETVGKVQQLILDKFKDNKKYPDMAENELFQKFVKFGADKRFGGTTAGMIVSLKGGFGLDDTTPDITQEFLDELTKVKVEESVNVIKDFSKFSAIMEEFDPAKFKKAASGAAVAPRAVNPKPAVVKKDVAVVPAPEQLAKAIEDAAKKIVDERDKKDLIAGLVAMGATEITKKVADNAIARSKTFRFYPNLKFYRALSGKFGSFPKDLSKGLDTEFTDESGAKTTFRKEEGFFPQYLQTIRKQLTRDLHGSNSRDKKLYTDILPKLNKREMLTIAQIWKNMYGESLLKQLDDEWTNTAEIREFTRKFADNLK